jgi:hypothetical protein
MDARPLADQILSRLQELVSARILHEQVWRDCYDMSFPLRGDGFQGEIIDAATGQTKRAQLLDGTSTDAGNLLAASLMSGLTPANALWAELYVSDSTDEEERWLHDSSVTLWELIHASNYDAAGLECMLDMVAAGWFGLYVDEHPTDMGLHFEQWPISQLFCASSVPGGPIDIVYRQYQNTAMQVVTEFGDKASQTVRDIAAKTSQKLIPLVRAIYPRKVYQVGATMGKNKKFASCTLERDTKHILRESGYDEMPCIVPRWTLLPNSVYAVGPMFDALPDVRELNDLVYLEKAGIEMAVAPPLKVVDDGVVNARSVKIGPRKMIVVNSMDSIEPLYDGARIDIAWSAKDSLQKAIRRTLMADQLQPQDGPAMTATEVHIRMQIIRQLLGPRYGRMQAEWLNALVQRTFGIALRMGRFAPMPDSLMSKVAGVRYLSPLARAQQLEEVTATERLFANAGAMMAIKPDVADMLDGDEALRGMGKALGVPSKVLRSVDDVAKLREMRAQQEAQMAQAAAMQPVLEEGGKALVKQAIGV